MKKGLIIFYLLLFSPSFCQIQIADSIDKTPIPFVHIISDYRIIIGTSNVNGIIDFQANVSLKDMKNDLISLHQISHQNSKFKVNVLRNADTIG